MRSRGFPTSLSDAKVLTMGIAGELQGRHDDSKIWHCFNGHGRGWYPGSRSLQDFCQALRQSGLNQTAVSSGGFPAAACDLHIIDGVPMPVSGVRRNEVFPGEAVIDDVFPTL